MLGQAFEEVIVFEDEQRSQQQQNYTKARRKNRKDESMQPLEPKSFCFQLDQNNEVEIQQKSATIAIPLVQAQMNSPIAIDYQYLENDDNFYSLRDENLSGISNENVPAFPLKLDENLKNDKNTKKLNKNEETSQTGQRINKNEESEREARMNKRKEKSRFKQLFDQQKNEKGKQKSKQKTQSKFEARNITRGFFHQQSPNQHQTTEIPLKANSLVKQRLEYIKEEEDDQMKIHARKLPPIIVKKQTKIQSKSTVLVDQNDSSLITLQKELAADRQKSNTHKQSPRNGSLALALRKIPNGKTMKCKFKRQKKCIANFYHPQYSLIRNNQTFILNSKKQWGHINSFYNLSCQLNNYSKQSKRYAGYLKGNFSGTCFNLFCLNNYVLQLVATIIYQSEIACSTNFRSLQVYIKDEKYSYNELEGSVQSEIIDLKQLFEIGENGSQNKIIKLVNKKPQWSEENECFIMDFKGKSKLGSVKNMILIEQYNQSRQALIFCKTDVNQFYMELTNPLNPFIAFGIVLSSFDFKVLCQ